ncbi:putative chromosome segregation protein SudA [Myxozyma melibiosi]|uniref:Structural maintenance of chromosomes protein n=1 Tax=Myxozyma melibiosi TaxID=54550 RepID=A0ABR1F358_9ASCO
MHIKQLVIQGFKSYKDQTVTDPFSPGHNVIVGRNGSGKSNFFAAIRFVLSDAYTHMSREERQALLHEGSGTAVMSAYVEIIFDNSDNRFPTGHPEVALRRTIGLKKDEYSLDRKSASKADVMNLLESAGFSRANPYYIVPQGRITALTNAKDAERLALLKEVAGTQVYETRRTESLKVITDSSARRKEIDDLLQFLDDRLGELDAEKDELREYQEKERERRCLEYTLQDRELSEINMHLEQLEEDRVRNSNSNNDRMALFAQRDQAIQNLENEISALKQKMTLVTSDYAQLEEERTDLMRTQAQLELELKDARDNEEDSARATAKRQADLESVLAQITTKEARLEELTPSFEAARQQETEVKRQLSQATEAQQRLYAKQGRNAQFSTKADRDKWLRKEIDDIKSTISQRESIRDGLQTQLEELTTQLENARSAINEARATLESSQGRLDDIQAQQTEQKRQRDALLDERKALWREDAKAKSASEGARDELERAERTFSSTMDRATSQGLAAVRQITKTMNLTGVYGPLCELFEVDDKYKTAVEVTGGTSLFHVVVDTDATATILMDTLTRERLGRVTFMPLNRLRSKPVNYPESDEVIPLIAKLRYAPEHAKAIEHVFSKTIICWNLDASSQYARSHGLNAITLQGDQANKKGVLTGGYHDSKRSRIDAVKNLRFWRESYETLRAHAAQITKEIEKKDQEVTQTVGNGKKLEQQRQQLIMSLGDVRDSLRNNNATESALQENISSTKQMLESTVTNLDSLEVQLSTLTAELRSKFDKNLNAEETRTLATLTQEIQVLRARDAELSNVRAELEQEKVLLELDLRQVLYMQRDQLRGEILEHNIASGSRGVEELESALESVISGIATNAQKIEELENEVEELESELSGRESEVANLQSQQVEDVKGIEREQKGLERAMAKRGILLQRKEELNRKIRDLGALPEEAFDKYSQMKSDTVLKRLHKLTEELKKFSHINKKAFEQYTSFTKQRDGLLARRQELDVSLASIEELIEVLDRHKDEAIERTFKQVSKGFAEIFEKLVPAGRGRLIMQRRTDLASAKANADDDDMSSDEEDSNDKDSVENYVGVAISVSFNSKSDEQQRIEQLSGGQKSLCALALIFAIQQCDPAPFYLFDEIDANLDAQYRTAVAAMIKELASEGAKEGGSGGQFICTTFRNEMIYVADKFYGVLFNNKISSIASITRENALTFVEGEQTR